MRRTPVKLRFRLDGSDSTVLGLGILGSRFPEQFRPQSALYQAKIRRKDRKVRRGQTKVAIFLSLVRVVWHA